MTNHLSSSEIEQAAIVVATFSVLVHAWYTSDFAEAAHAEKELGELGVGVRLTPRSGRSCQLLAGQGASQ